MVIFVAGAVTGAVVYTQFIQKKVQQQRPTAASYPPRPDFWKWMGDKLELSQEQRDKINQIVTDSHDRLKPLKELIDPVMQEELRRVNDEIMNVLTPEQRQKFEDFMKRGSRRSEGQPPGGFGPPPGRPPDGRQQQGMRPDGRPPFSDQRFKPQSNRWGGPPMPPPPQSRQQQSTNQ